jgi:hypothetical protein
MTVMQLNPERRLVFATAPTWVGWFCERCFWHIALGAQPTLGPHTVEVQAQFDAHDCEECARQTWKNTG